MKRDDQNHVEKRDPDMREKGRKNSKTVARGKSKNRDPMERIASAAERIADAIERLAETQSK
jgi:hypothetical protein